MEIQTKRRLSSTVSLIELETAISREKNKLTDDKIISVCQLFWISHQNIRKTNKKESFVEKKLSIRKNNCDIRQKHFKS